MRTKIVDYLHVKGIKHILNILIILIFFSSLILFEKYYTTQNKIVQISQESSIAYTKDISQNIANSLKYEIGHNFYNTLQSDTMLQKHISNFLGNFVTDKYKYIYLVDRDAHNLSRFRFLSDGSKEDKSYIGDLYMPLDIEWWNRVYETKKDVFFTHNNMEDVWMTYLKPIILDGKIEAILVIDFSMSEQRKIEELFDIMKSFLNKAIIVFLIIFVLLLIISFIDGKREQEKAAVYNKLDELNKSLEKRIAQAVEETQHKEQLLQQQSRLAQMGEMLSMIAHQWRQPLNAIASTTIGIKLKLEFNKYDLSKEEQVEEFKEFLSKKLENINDFTQVLSSTIDDFRNFFKADKEKEKVALTEPISRALFIVESSLRSRGIELGLNYEVENKVSVFQNEIMQTILNIIKNSEDNFEEKKIQKPKIEISTKEFDTHYTITICDNGGGIDDTIVEKIFDPYFTTKDEKNGSGLGLYMSKIMIEQHHNGKLEVYNKNGGICFEILLKKE